VLFADGVFSRVIRSAPGYSFLLVARVCFTCRHAVWRPPSLHSCLRNSTNVHRRHLGHRLQSLLEAPCQVDWTHMTATTRLLRVSEAACHPRHHRKTTHSPILPNLVQHAG